MKISDLTQDELDVMGYDDIAFMILDESNKKMKLADLFKKVCKILLLSDAEYEERLVPFFELLTSDQRFIMLEKGNWDLRSKHSTKIVIDEEEDDDIILDVSDEIEEEEETNNDDIFYDREETDDTTEDDLKDLVVVDEDDEEANGLV